MLLSLSLKGVEGRAAAARAAQDVARAAARQLLLPLLDAAVARLAAVLRRTWHICVEDAAAQGAWHSHILHPCAPQLLPRRVWQPNPASVLPSCCLAGCMWQPHPCTSVCALGVSQC